MTKIKWRYQSKQRTWKGSYKGISIEVLEDGSLSCFFLGGVFASLSDLVNQIDSVYATDLDKVTHSLD